MEGSGLIELHFLPSLEYFCALQRFNEIIIERHERFVKQSYRNRCYIRTTQRIEMLSVPLTSKHHRALFRDIRIDSTRRWSAGMSRTIMSAYRSSPFYEHYAGDLQALLSRPCDFIYDLDLSLMAFCLKALRWQKKISETTEFRDPAQDGVDDFRSLITDREGFAGRGIYSPVKYYQVFGNDFGENLSVIDLLFCKGPEAGDIVAKSVATN
jgi:hypothetical protein